MRREGREERRKGRVRDEGGKEGRREGKGVCSRHVYLHMQPLTQQVCAE